MVSIVDRVLDYKKLPNKEIRNKLVGGFIFARHGLLWLNCLWKVLAYLGRVSPSTVSKNPDVKAAEYRK